MSAEYSAICIDLTLYPTTKTRDMETTDYCNYDLSLALKAAGFDEPCDHYWSKEFANSDKVVLRQASADDYNNDDWDVPHCSAPLIYHAQKWLREKLLLNVGVNPAIPTLKWQFYIDDLNQHINPHDGELMTRWDDDMQERADERLYDSYEQALTEGLESALELIKRGE